jgi:hypothetical protein
MISGVNAYLFHTLSRTHFVCSSSLPSGYRKREWRYESVSASTQTLTENASLFRRLSPFIPPALHHSKFIFTHCTDTFSTGWHVYECDHYSFQEDTYEASFHELLATVVLCLDSFSGCPLVFCGLNSFPTDVLLCSLDSFPTCLLVCGFNSCPPSPLVFGLSPTSGFCIIIDLVTQTECREKIFRYHFWAYGIHLKSIIIVWLF